MKQSRIVPRSAALVGPLMLLLLACASDGPVKGAGAPGAPCPPALAGSCANGCTPSGACATAPLGGTVSPGGVDQPQTLIVDTDAPPSPTADSKCIEVVVGFESITPTVMIVVDRSGSMDAPFDLTRDRWNTVRDTLTNPQTGLIKRWESVVRLGLMLYTAGKPPVDVCPSLINAPIALNNFQQIQTVFGATELLPEGNTPTAETIQAAAAALVANTEPGPKAIVLATDGDPDNCMDVDDHGPTSKAGSVSAVSAAFAQGIKTFVISVDDEVTQTHLKDLAVAGQNDPTAEAYSALNALQLEAAFAQIIGGVRSCIFALKGNVPAFHAPKGAVTVGGLPLTFNDPNGWVLVNGDTVEIKGTACDSLLTGDSLVNISFPCVPEAQLAK